MLRNPEEFIDYPKVIVKDSAIKSIASGAQIMFPAVRNFPKAIERDKLVSLYSESGKFAGVGKTVVGSDDFEKINSGLVVKLERVHI